MRINVNPNVEASASFDVVKPGVYRMRVQRVDNFTAQSGSECLKVWWEYVDPSNVEKLSGGFANNPGTLIDSGLVISPADKQGKLRGLVEALGKNWSDFDTDELIGLECDVKVKVEEYNGEQRNSVARYLAPQV